MNVQPEIHIEKILEYDDLFHGEDFDIEATLCKYSRELIIRLVNCLGLTYEKAYLPDANNPFFSSITPKVQDLDSRLSHFLVISSHKRICYCTQRSILELLRYTFAIPIDKYANGSNLDDFEYDFFKILLKINQQLMHFKSETSKDNIETLTFLLSYILNDVTNADWKSIYQTQFYYIDCLIFFLQGTAQGQILIEKFCKKLNISSIKEYEQTLLALTTLYISKKKENSRSCPVLDLNEIVDETGFFHEEVCEYLSLDINKLIPYTSETRENNIDYRELRAHPIIKVENRKYIIYNLPILCERLYNSLFFDFKEFYRGDFFQYYNKEFTEHFLFQRTMLLCIGKKVSAFSPSKKEIVSFEPVKENLNAPDFYIREGDSIILFECKGIKINGSIKDRADVDEFMNVLKTKLLLSAQNIDPTRLQKSKPELVGISQLARSIEAIEDYEFEMDDKIPSAVSYYPVIVFEDPKLAQIGMIGLLNKWYRQYLHEHGLTEQVCNPVIAMSISTLYLFADKFRIFGFQKIFDEFISSNIVESATEQISPFADFDWYMRKRYKIAAYVQREFTNKLSKLKIKS